MKITFIVILNTLLLIFLLNFIIVFYPEKILNKNILGDKLINNFGYLYHVYFKDSYDRNFKKIKNYSVFVGDSYILGTSEGKLLSNVGIFFRQKYPNNSFFEIGYPAGSYDFQEKLLNKIVNKIKKDPKKIFLFIYEGNDYYDEISFHSKTKKDLFLKNLKLDVYNYFPLLAKVSEYSFFKIRSLFLKQSVKAAKQTEINNEIFINNRKITLKNQEVQNACGLKNENDKNMFFKSLTDYSNRLDKKYPSSNKIFIYIPSPATLYKYNIIVSKNYLLNKYEKLNQKENFDCHKKNIKMLNEFFMNNTRQKFYFHDLTSDLKKITKNQLIHGLKDINHFNKEGYKFFAQLIFKL